MRSTVLPLLDGGGGVDDDHHRKELFSSVYWWRSLPEFDAGGRAEVFSSRASGGLTPWLRVVKELERLAVLAHESLDDLRHKLLTYRAGDLWFPAGGIPKQETDIPPVITILLLGLAGSGKSSLVNLMYSVFGRSGFVPFAHTASPAGKDGRTQYLEEHNVLRSTRNGFCVFDSRGLDYNRLAEGLDEVAEWMEDGIRHRQPCRGSALPEPASAGPSSAAAAAAAAKRFVRRRVNCAMVVVDLSELHQSLVSGDLRPLEATRELFHSPSIQTYCNDNPILVLTHGDELTAEERINTRVRVCEYLGVSETVGVYDVACVNEHGCVDEADPVTAYAVAEAVYRALLVSDRGHPPKPNVKDWLILVLSWAMCALSAFFAFLSASCSKMAKASREQKFRPQ
ncbi:uncharacterized protein [Elaeis guineensis]|uniref:Uncharacterized protein LOC105052558 n=1 Tax=Elaeis guineensis var. tenera TaxID=51953 RepID=A0A6J0PN24_ELAGV|nr:uncharacterized protein LOC105052558 [Elaeis guineensis]